MLKKEDITHLAELARIEISDEEKDGLAKDLDSVLTYVSEVSKITTEADATPRAGELRNVSREDVSPHAGGAFTDMIIANAPNAQDGYVKVQQIQA